MGNANVKPETLATFKKLVFTKYGKLHGVLCKEIDIALQNRGKEIKIELNEKGGLP
jgi:hypothetical protein